MDKEELVALLKVSQELAARLDLQHVLQTTTDRLADLSGMKSAAVYLLDGGILRLWATTPPLPPQFPEELRNAPLADHPHIGKALTTRAPVFLYDTATADLTPAERAAIQLRSLRSILYLPLLAGGKVTGTLITGTVEAPQLFSDALIDLCRTFANLAALAVENAQLYAASQHYAAELERKIAAARQAEAAQQEAMQRLQKIACQLPGVVYQFRLNPDGSACLPYASDGLRATFGVNPEEVREDASKLFARIPPDDYERVMSTIQASARDLSQWNQEFRVVLDDGTVHWLLGNAMPQREAGGSMLWHGFATDITGRRQMENLVIQENNFRKDLINSLPGIFYMLNSSGECLMWNRNLEDVLKCSGDEISNSHLLDFFEGTDCTLIEENIHKVFEAGETSVETELVAKDGTKTPYYLTGKRIKHKGMPVLIGLGIDITERKQAEERVRKLAHFDPLTGLPNRSLLTDRVGQAISMAQRSHDKLAVLFVDLDHFKNINDTLGHRIGDELLIEIAKRLQAIVRDEDTIARFGGDEFILLLPGADTNGAAHVARKLLHTVSRHYLIEQHELVITPSIGIAMYPSDGEDFDALSKCADIAMYRAKRDGRNNYRFFTPEMQARSARNLQLENALRRALERGQLQLHYQPQMALQDGRIIGAEALLRWVHPELGMISPAEFIPVAEDSGLILPIGEWVLRTAIRQLKAWMDSGIPPMIIAVNLSAVQFRQPKLLNLVTRILKEEGLPPQLLELELTEGVTMNDPVTAVKVMDNLHERGIRMSIDDFGTGYSSLSQLKRFQVYKLKIDKSFVQDLVEDPDDKAIVKAIINVAKGLGLRTIAEGVETKAQLEFLQEHGCDEIQGFHFSKPITADQFETFVRGN